MSSSLEPRIAALERDVAQLRRDAFREIDRRKIMHLLHDARELRSYGKALDYISERIAQIELAVFVKGKKGGVK